MRWVLDIEGVRPGIAGIVGGVAMGAFEAIATSSVERGLLAPLELLGASHPFARAHPVLVGVAMHLTTAAFWGTRLGIIAAAAPARVLRGWPALVGGIVWGAGVWVVMGKIVGPLVNPLVASAPEPQFLVGHLLYGIVSVLVLRVVAEGLKVERRDRTARVQGSGLLNARQRNPIHPTEKSTNATSPATNGPFASAPPARKCDATYGGSSRRPSRTGARR